MGKNIKGLNFIDGIMPPQPINPYDEGYIAHNNLENSKKFPNCCNFHKDAFVMLEKWFEDIFPLFSKEMELKYKKEFKKDNYTGHTLKIIKQISYTEYFISKKINSSNWYDEIRHYIDYNVWCLGVPQLGFGIYVYFVMDYLKNIEKNIAEEKRDKIIAYCEQKLNTNISNAKEQDTTDISVIYTTIQKWLDIFPFEFEEFSEYKKFYDQISLIITGIGDYNPYTGLIFIDTITKSELINLLIDTTKSLLTNINGAIHVKNGESIQKINKYKTGVTLIYFKKAFSVR